MSFNYDFGRLSIKYQEDDDQFQARLIPLTRSDSTEYWDIKRDTVNEILPNSGVTFGVPVCGLYLTQTEIDFINSHIELVKESLAEARYIDRLSLPVYFYVYTRR